jgi:hypothetical protein
MRHAWVAGLLTAFLLCAPGLASAEPRIALIIANGTYGGDIGSLKNPVSDGKLMSEALKKVGFTVILVTDGDQRRMTGLFYYAGHGLQASGENYLVPVGAHIKSQGDVDLEALSAETVLKVLSFSGVEPQLGACEKHVIRGGSFGRGSKFLSSAYRGGMKEDVRGVSNSIRLVREL